MPVVGKQNSLVVQCALPIEARCVAARLRRARRGSLGLFQAWEGMLGDVPVLVVVSGMGTMEAAIAASEVIRLFEPVGLVAFGAAGALIETWPIGKCALVRCAAAYQPPRLIPQPTPGAPRPTVAEAWSDGNWLKVGEDVLHLPMVRVGCADPPVTNLHLARYLAAAYGFDWVDCESYSVLDVAARHGVRAVGLRSVSDHCGPDAPKQFERNARRALREAAKLLSHYVVALHKAGLLGPRT